MRITERQLRSFIRESVLSEIRDEALMVPPGERYKNLAMDPETKQRVSDAMISAGEGAIDFAKSLGEMIIDLNVYFKSGQVWIDAVRGLTGVDLTPENEREWRATIAAASLHDFLDKFGTAGVDAADLINAFLYTLEGNWRMAGICSMAAIPAVGSAIKGEVKFAIKAAEDVAAVDAGISRVKQGFKASGLDGSDKVIAEIDKIRAEMGRKTADFSPYDQIPAERMQAVKEVANNPSRLKQAYDDLRERVSADPAKYRAADEFNPADYPQGWSGIVPEYLTPAREAMGKEMLSVWEKHADQNFFNQEVKKVHWLGFSSKESRTALRALSDFLQKAPSKKASQISTVGYLEDLNPGPRAGASFQTGPQGSQIQAGIKLRGDTKYATTTDAFTTNPSAATRQSTASFEKIPRATTSTLGELVRSNPTLYPELYAELQQDIAATGRYTDPKWMETATISPGVSATSVDSKIMLDRASWREPYTGAAVHNEIVLDNWEPEAVIINTKSASTKEIGQIKALADKHGLPLLDTTGAEVKMSDYERFDRAHVPNKPGIKRGVWDTSSPEFTRDPKTGKVKYKGVEYAEEEVPSEREAMYENNRLIEAVQAERWAQLAGLLKG